MKKCIALLLILTICSSFMLTSTVIHAEDSDIIEYEREEIIEAAEKSWWIYNSFCGPAWLLGSLSVYDYDEIPERLKDVLNYFDGVIPENFKHIGMNFEGKYGGRSYIETTFSSEEEYIEYIDSIFIGNELDLEKENNSFNPRTRIVDGKLYVSSIFAMINSSDLDWGFDNAKIEKIGSKVVVTVELTETMQAEINDSLGYEVIYFKTIELVETSEGWKVCGGSMFYGDLYTTDWTHPIYNDNDLLIQLYSPENPDTGEDVIFYTTIALTALAVGIDILVRKRKKDVV